MRFRDIVCNILVLWAVVVADFQRTTHSQFKAVYNMYIESMFKLYMLFLVKQRAIVPIILSKISDGLNHNTAACIISKYSYLFLKTKISNWKFSRSFAVLKICGISTER